MNIKIHTSTIAPMLSICERYISGGDIARDLEKLLNHEDYLVEFERYNLAGGPRGGFSKEEVIEFFTQLNNISYEDIKNVRLKARLESFKYLLDNLEKYKALVPFIESITVEKVQKAIENTKNGLPGYIDFEEVEIIFSIGLGPSMGWFYKNYSHYDVITFFKDFDEEVLLNTIAHEYHHVGLKKMFENIDDSSYNLEEAFYSSLAGEGLAIKYCNNYKGVLTTNIHDERVNVGLDDYSLRYYEEEFNGVYEKFLSDIQDIRNGKIKTQEELLQLFMKYWMSIRSNRVKENEPDDLGQSMNYFLGGDIWGLIHDIYGKDKLYEILMNPSFFTNYYNKALYKIGRNDLLIPEAYNKGERE